MRTKLLLPAVALAIALWAIVVSAAQPEFEEADDAFGYIRTLQETDGGFPAFGPGSTAGSTLDAVFAIAATGRDAKNVTTSGNGPDEYLATQAASYSSDPGAAAKLSLGVSIVQLDPSDFGGVDLLSVMSASYNAGTGEYGLDLFDEGLHMLALAAAGGAVPPAATAHLASLQQGDGGWEFAPGWGSDTNTSALALEALIAGGTPAGAMVVQDGLDYLASAQNGDGGFGYLAADPSDPNSTAVVVQALVAAGEDIDEGGPWAPGGNTPLEGLLSFRNASTGAFQYFGSDSAFATYQALPALMLAPFPQIPTAQQAEPGDSDGDGCSDAREGGTDAALGGRRDYLRPWDFYDTNGDKDIDLFNDIFGVAFAFGTEPGDAGYDAALDRAPPPTALEEPDPNRRELWDLGPPDGAIDLFNDIFGVAFQFGHRCTD